MMNPLQIPDHELVSIHRYVGLQDITVTGDGWEELSEVNQHDAPQGLSPLVPDRETYQVVMCLCGGLGYASSGSGLASGCG